MTVVIHNLLGEPEPLIVPTTFPDDVDVAAALADAATSPVGIGNPFYVFGELPPELANGMATDWEDAATCSADAEDNQSAIDAMLANPPTGKVWAA